MVCLDRYNHQYYENSSLKESTVVKNYFNYTSSEGYTNLQYASDTTHIFKTLKETCACIVEVAFEIFLLAIGEITKLFQDTQPPLQHKYQILYEFQREYQIL
jgi:hypothetical protein